MEKSIINKLSDDIIKKINISHLICSPSCVLKELLENSFDAFSSDIKIYIEDVGLKLIKVVDNGVGIYKEDLRKVCLRYNTSKILKMEDLYSLETYGFRGEALFLINSVSNLILTSKPFDQKFAYKIAFSNLNVSASQGCNGTSTEIQDLFFNDVYFKSFLRDLDFERKKIFDMFVCMSLAKFNIRFLFFYNGVEVFNLPPCSNSFSKVKRIETVNECFKFDDVIDINFYDGIFGFYGFIYINSVKRVNKKFNFFFVNDRIVNNNIIEDILLNIFKSITKTFFSLSYCFYFYLDPVFYSVIFSPKKFDIFFKDYPFIYNFLFKLIFNSFFNKKKNEFVNNKVDFLKNKKINQIDISNFFCMNSSEKKLYVPENSVLTVLDNSDVFFSLNNKVYVVKLSLIRSKSIFKLFSYQYVKFGKLLKKKVVCCELFDLNVFNILIEFKKLLFSYGVVFDVFNDKFLVVNSIPILLYNLSVNWHALFLDLKFFLEKSIFNSFSKNRFDSNVVNIFIKHIYDRSFCNKYEVNLFYNELIYSSLNDVSWFNKNCYEVVCK